MSVENVPLSAAGIAATGKSQRPGRSQPGGADRGGGLGFLVALASASDPPVAEGPLAAMPGAARKAAGPDNAAAAASDGAAPVPAWPPEAGAEELVQQPPVEAQNPSQVLVGTGSGPLAGLPGVAAGPVVADVPAPAPLAAAPPPAAAASRPPVDAQFFGHMQAVLHQEGGVRVVRPHGLPAVATRHGAAGSVDVSKTSQLANALAAPASLPVHAAAPPPVPFGMEAAVWLALPTGTPATLRREEAPRSAGAAAPGEAAAGAGMQAPQVGEAGSVAPVDATPAAFAAAEEPRYWGSPAVQNAELTLQAEGADVAVRVSLAGQEAHVAFRSDHAPARELLSSAVGDLHSMLAAQGLTLGGVSVGAHQTSGSSGGEAQQGREGRDGAARRGLDGAAGAADSTPARTPRAAPAGTLDLYV